MYILREIVSKTIFPKPNSSQNTRYLHIGSSGRCHVRILGPMYSCSRIYLDPKYNLIRKFSVEELGILVTGNITKVEEYGNKNPSFRKKMENLNNPKTGIDQSLEFFCSAKGVKYEPDAYLVNCLTRQGNFMGKTTALNIKIMSLPKSSISIMKDVYGENLEDISGVVARDIIMEREQREQRPLPALPVYGYPTFATAPATEPTPDRQIPRLQPVRYLPNDEVTHLSDVEIKYISENGLLDIQENIDFENTRTLTRGSGYYITNLKEIGDKIPDIKFKGKLRQQLIDLEEEKEVSNLEGRFNQIPSDLIGNETVYDNSILSLEL